MVVTASCDQDGNIIIIIRPTTALLLLFYPKTALLLDVALDYLHESLAIASDRYLLFAAEVLVTIMHNDLHCIFNNILFENSYRHARHDCIVQIMQTYNALFHPKVSFADLPFWFALQPPLPCAGDGPSPAAPHHGTSNAA